MNDELDKLLEEFAREKLSGQLGRAEAHFLAHHADAPPVVHRRPAAFWRWATLATAAAAMLAIGALLTVQWMRPSAPKNGGVVRKTPFELVPDGPSALANSQELLDRQTWSRDLDAGTLLLDEHTPVRVIHQQVVEQRRYYDPASRSMTTVTVPQDKVRLVNLTTY